MNELERTEVGILISATLDFIEAAAAEPEDSEQLRAAIKRVLALVYA